MSQPIPTVDMLEGEVMFLLGLTQRNEHAWEARVDQYLVQWASRLDHVAASDFLDDPERWHFHDEYMVWYRQYTRRWTSRRETVQQSIVCTLALLKLVGFHIMQR